MADQEPPRRVLRRSSQHDMVTDERIAPRTIASALTADLRRGAACAGGALAGAAAVDVLATLVVYSEQIRPLAVLRLVVLALALFSIAWLVLAPLLALAFATPRAVAAVWRGRNAAARRAGPGERPITARTVARAWAFVLVAAGYVPVSAWRTYHGIARYKEPVLRALLLAVEQVLIALVLLVAGIALAAAVERAGAWLDRRLAARTQLKVCNPLARAVPAFALISLAATCLLVAVAVTQPHLRPLIPWRWGIVVAGAVCGEALTVHLIRRRPVAGRQRRRGAQCAAGAAALLVPLALIYVGAHPEAKGMAISASPPLSTLVALVRAANDFDRDGFGSLLGENDCAPRNARVRPGARDIPDNGVDENCNGRDSSLRDLIAPSGNRRAVPEALRRKWNILLITVDTVRYDHTSFGGYLEQSGRDTTPELAEMVERSVSFTFANAPSPGTMASVPAILTSKFFHSGIALAEPRKRGLPPKLKPENWTLPELLKRGGYTTGAILSHEYFNEWGMEQGFDSYDNEIGRKPDPSRVSSHVSTDRALAWIGDHANEKWFLWVHYLDPHGRYVAHPDGPNWGTSEMDLYDGELRYTDQHLGRLFDELARLPGGERTIVILTSDHGDAFGEHGSANHGNTLYRELLHVPLIVAIPDVIAREVGGAVSPIDVVPTIADLAGIDVSDLSFEGRSLVPQIFYGEEDPDRVVFAETNYQNVLRAAISEQYKLIFDLKNNHYKLFDLRKDPLEKADASRSNPDALRTMREHLDAWLDRVMFARDPTYNQAIAKVTGVLLDQAPSPTNRVQRTTLDEGRIEVLGWELDPPADVFRPGDKLDAYVYLAVNSRPSGAFKLQMSGWLADRATFDPRSAPGNKITRSPMRTTAGGFLPSDRWLPGEFIKERFGIVIPEDWAGQPADALVLGLVAQGDGGKVPATGHVAADGHTVVLGTAELDTL